MRLPYPAENVGHGISPTMRAQMQWRLKSDILGKRLWSLSPLRCLGTMALQSWTLTEMLVCSAEACPLFA